MRSTPTPPTAPDTPSAIADLAAATPTGRNRAIDAYRAGAMLAVALGHWAATAIWIGDDGAPAAGNALEWAPRFAPITWLLQVMPLFFVVGGFASAASLDAHHRSSDASDADWLAARLRRLYAPVALLAGVWLAVVGLGWAVGDGGLAVLAAGAAAIPLWFIANYTIDTVAAPLTRPAFARHPGRCTLGLVGAFLAFELVRFDSVVAADLGVLAAVAPVVNWVLGWLIFQVLGFAWRDGIVRPGRRLAVASVAALGAAAALLAFGPYPLTMVHVDGIAGPSPTHPPSLALVLFGLGHAGLFVSAAPAVDRFLQRSPRAWAATVAANGVSMSVYLWHFTAIAIAGAVLHAMDALPTAPVGSGAWWIEKLPMIGLAALILVPIVAVVSRVERGALLAPRTTSRHSFATLAVAGVTASTAVKVLWTDWTPTGIVAGAAIVVVLHLSVFRQRRRQATPVSGETMPTSSAKTTTFSS